MEEISLTGATLTSDTSNADLAVVGANGSNAAAGGKPCCQEHGPATRALMIPNLMTIEKMKMSTNDEILNGLSLNIRLGPYEKFDAIVKALLEFKGELDGKAILETIGKDGHSLLHWSTKRADDSRFLSLLCSLVPPDFVSIASTEKVGMTPLHWACTEGSVPLVAILLKAGANLEATDHSGCTPLLIAAQYGQVDIVAFLLQRGANGLAVDKSLDSALHWAAYKGSIHVCGLLLFRQELYWTTPDSFGQTPLHLASLRGHTTVVRYLLQEGTRAERKQLLFLKDKNGKTPLDLAIHRKRPTVASVLRGAMEALEFQHHGSTMIWKVLKKNARQFFSVHSWKIWLGCHATNDEVDEAPKLPFYWFVVHLFIYTAWYPLVFLPLNISKGVLYDFMTWHYCNFVVMAGLYYFLYKCYVTNPGFLDETNPKTVELRQLYEQTLESYATDDADKQKMPLCHTCRIARPLRSKHCRVTRRCVLMFDHHCPFVGNTVGLYNYRYFYLMLLFLTLAITGFTITLVLYLQRRFSWVVLFAGAYLSCYILLGGGLLTYHTQLSVTNLMTNEHQNMRRYPYLRDGHGRYRNAFFRGWMASVLDRCLPSERAYTLEESQKALLEDHDHDNSNIGGGSCKSKHKRNHHNKHYSHGDHNV